MKIKFNNHDFDLHPSGALLWPSENMMIVSDLHLEKGSHFALRGFFLPPYDTHKTLERLANLCLEHRPETLILLGDSFHDPKGYSRLDKSDRLLFENLRAFNPLWIVGNHDGEFVPPDFHSLHEFEHQGLVFRHEAIPGVANEITGHFHPKASIGDYKNAPVFRCFIEDGYKLILPAFGAFTGGMFVTEPEIKNLFVAKPRIYLLGKEKIYLKS